MKLSNVCINYFLNFLGDLKSAIMDVEKAIVLDNKSPVSEYNVQIK